MNAYGIAVIGILQIISYSILSLIVEVSSDRIYDALITVKWYNLPSNVMKSYYILLQSAQQRKRLYIAGVIPLNMETCLQVLTNETITKHLQFNLCNF